MAIIFATTMFAQNNTNATKVAIYTSGDVDPGYKKVIGSKVTSYITQTSKYAAVERTADFLNVLSQEQDYQMSGAVSDNQIVKIGQQFGVGYVVVIDISNLFESLYVSVRMIDVTSGLIVYSGDVSGTVNSFDELTNLASQAGSALFGVEKIEFQAIDTYTAFDMFNFRCPSGYHIANSKEMEMIIKYCEVMDISLKEVAAYNLKKIYECPSIPDDWSLYESVIYSYYYNGSHYHNNERFYRARLMGESSITYNSDSRETIYVYVVKN